MELGAVLLFHQYGLSLLQVNTLLEFSVGAVPSSNKINTTLCHMHDLLGLHYYSAVYTK